MASKDDVEAVIALVKEFVANTSYSVSDLDDDYLSAFVNSYCLSDQTRYTLLLLKFEDAVVGFLAALINDAHPLFSKVKVASELAWYVAPVHRGHGELLMDAFELWSKTMGCKYATVSDLPSLDLSGWYGKRGFELAERSYIKVIN